MKKVKHLNSLHRGHNQKRGSHYIKPRLCTKNKKKCEWDILAHMISLLLCQLQSKGVIVKEISICHLLAACDVLSGNYEINARLLFLKKRS